MGAKMKRISKLEEQIQDLINDDKEQTRLINLDIARTSCIQSCCPGSLGGDHDGRCGLFVQDEDF